MKDWTDMSYDEQRAHLGLPDVRWDVMQHPVRLAQELRDALLPIFHGLNAALDGRARAVLGGFATGGSVQGPPTASVEDSIIAHLDGPGDRCSFCGTRCETEEQCRDACIVPEDLMTSPEAECLDVAEARRGGELMSNYPAGAWCPKMMREHLCAQQTHAPDTETAEAFQALIDVLDRHRPLGPDGKHGTAHTDTCGCA